MRVCFACLLLAWMAGCSGETESGQQVIAPVDAGLDGNAGSGHSGAGGTAGSSGTSGSSGAAGAAGVGGAAGGSGSGGGTLPPAEPTALTAGVVAPVALAVDSKYVYWSDKAGEGRIVKCALAGCDSEQVVLATGLKMPKGVALDTDTVYFGTLEAIMSVGKDGTGLKEIAGFESASWLTLSGSPLYWSTGNGVQVMACEKSDCGATREVLADGQSLADVVAVSDTDVYWTSMTGVGKCSNTGCNQTPTLFANDGAGNGLALGEQSVFWTINSGNALFACPMSGCGDGEHYLSFDVGGHALVVSDGFLYYALYFGGEVGRLDIDGMGQPEILGTGPDGAWDMVADASAIYWTTSTAVMTMAK